jgi:flagellar protein FliS
VLSRPHQLRSYQAVQTTTADPLRLVLQLLDEAIRALYRAERGLDRGDVAAFAQALSRGQAIVGELAACLDHERGEPIASNLARLYDFIRRQLTRALVARSRPEIGQVLGLLREIHEGFEGAARRLGGDARTPRHGQP